MRSIKEVRTNEVHTARLSGIHNKPNRGQQAVVCCLGYGLRLGKTSCTLTAIEELIADRFEIDRALVIAPLRVADDTWESERDKWEHLQGLTFSKILGTEKQRIKALSTEADVYTINRENVKWLVDYHLKNRMTWKFDMIVIDESSSFKSHDSQRFKALRKVTKYAKRVVLLTGTPDPNGLLDLWSQAYLLDEGERLGKTITAYRDRYFRPGRRNGNVIYEYLPKAGAKEAIFDTLKDIMVSLSAKDHLRMPERIDNVIKIKMPAAARAKYDQMEEDSILELEKADVVAGNKAAVTNKLLQMANGAVYYEDLIPGEDGELETVRKVEWVHDAKLDALEQIVEDSAGQPIMVFYSYQHDCERLMKRFAKYNPGTIKDRESIAAWNAGKVKLLIAHPASMGHGLNLQAGGNIIVWFGVPNNLEYYLQANARLYRQGQQQTVVINHLLMENTHDMDVMESLTQKKVNQDELIAAVKARIAERKGSSGNK